jgi:hypothetical protein
VSLIEKWTFKIPDHRCLAGALVHESYLQHHGVYKANEPPAYLHAYLASGVQSYDCPIL